MNDDERRRHERSWNDPPLFSYDQLNKPTSQASLHKRYSRPMAPEFNPVRQGAPSGYPGMAGQPMTAMNYPGPQMTSSQGYPGQQMSPGYNAGPSYPHPQQQQQQQHQQHQQQQQQHMASGYGYPGQQMAPNYNYPVQSMASGYPSMPQTAVPNYPGMQGQGMPAQAIASSMYPQQMAPQYNQFGQQINPTASVMYNQGYPDSKFQ